MNSWDPTGWQYLAIILAVGALTALQAALAQGQLPVPPEWAWVLPVVNAALVALTARLRQLIGQ